MYYFVLAIFVFGFLLIYRTIHSPFGQVLKAIRENEPRAISLGYQVDRYKLVAFVLSAALSGLAGATKAIGVPARHADRRPLAHLGRGGADDPAGRHGHRSSARWSGAFIVVSHAELSRASSAAG